MSALLSIVPLIALFTLMLSFCVTENECCANNAEINENFNVIVIAHIVKEERIATVVRMVVVVY